MIITLSRSVDGLPWHVAVSHIISYGQRYMGEDTVVQTIETDEIMIVNDRPEEIAALIEAEIRKQRRYEIAARLTAADVCYKSTPEHHIKRADALLDALEGGAA